MIDLIGPAILHLVIGILLGIFMAWNKKAFFLFYILILISFIVVYVGGIDKVYVGFIWWMFLWDLFWATIGIWMGGVFYKQTWSEK